MNWTEGGQLVENLNLPIDQQREVTDPELLLEKLISLNQVKAEYAHSQNQEFEKAIADKDQQIAWVTSRLPFKLYSSEELEALLQLFRLSLPEGADDGEEYVIGTIRVRWLTELSCWGVHEPKFINPQFLEPHPFNSAIYGENEDVSDLVSMIAESRWIKRLTINLKGQILAGNRRLLALQQLDWQEPVEIEIVRLSGEKEIELLVLDNASREKTTEQRVREADVYANIPGWLKKQREVLRCKHGTASKKSARTREILAQKVGIGSGYTYDKARQVCQAITFFEQQEDKETAENLRQLLNEKSVDAAHKEWEKLEEKLNTRYCYTGLLTIWAVEGNQSIEVPQRTELVIAKEVDNADSSRVACRLPGRERSLVMVPRGDLALTPTPLPREREKEGGKILPPQTLHTINAAVSSYLAEMPNPLSTCELVEEFYAKGNKAAVGCVEGIANRWPVQERTEELKEAIAAAFVAAKSNLPKRQFKARDEIVRKERPEIKGEILSWHNPLNQWYVKWTDGIRDTVAEADLAVPPAFLVGDKVDLLFRDSETGIVEQVRWLNDGWTIKIKTDEGTVDVPEDHLQRAGTKKVANLKVGDWVSDGSSWAIVRSLDGDWVSLKYLGMGDCPAPMEGNGRVKLVKADLRVMRFDPYKPPKYALRYFKAGDIVCPAWETTLAKKKIGQIKGVNERKEYQIELFNEDRTLELREDKLTLLQPYGVALKRGEEVRVKQEANLPVSCLNIYRTSGKILNIYRTCADVLLEGDLPESPVRLPLDWLEPKLPTSFLDCASKEDFEITWQGVNDEQRYEMALELWGITKEKGEKQ